MPLITRRNALLGLFAAPAIVAIERLMPVKALLMPQRLILSGTTIAADAVNGTLIGTLSVEGLLPGEEYQFSVETAENDGSLYLDPHIIAVTADDGHGSVLRRSFAIPVVGA